MHGREFLEWYAIDEIIETILRGAVTDDHYSFAGVFDLHFIEKILHARSGLRIALTTRKWCVYPLWFFDIHDLAWLLGKFAIVTFAQAGILHNRPLIAKTYLRTLVSAL